VGVFNGARRNDHANLARRRLVRRGAAASAREQATRNAAASRLFRLVSRSLAAHRALHARPVQAPDLQQEIQDRDETTGCH